MAGWLPDVAAVRVERAGTRQFMADLSGRVDRAELALSNLEQRQRSFEQLGVFARLWWLVTGR